MDRITTSSAAPKNTWLRETLRWYLKQGAWKICRLGRIFTRRFGLLGWGTLALLVIIVLLGWVTYDQKTQRSVLSSRLAAQAALPVSRLDTAPHSNGRDRIKAFESHLLLHEDIPVAVQDVLRSAEEEGLLIQKGEYRPKIDLAGNFIRYRMNLPVQGAAPAIYRFIQTALHTQKTLAIESVQFRRERIGSSEIEAHIQWVILTRLPIYQPVTLPPQPLIGSIK